MFCFSSWGIASKMVENHTNQRSGKGFDLDEISAQRLPKQKPTKTL